MKSRDLALAELTLRKYERPFNLKGRDLVNKLCLSVGLLQPGDSRDVVVDVFTVLLRSKKALSSKEIEEKVISMRKKHKLPLVGIAPSNLRRQVKRLRDLYLIEKVANTYRVTEREKLLHIYNEKIEQFLLKSVQERVKEYFEAVDNEFAHIREKKPRVKKAKNIDTGSKVTVANKEVESLENTEQAQDKIKKAQLDPSQTNFRSNDF